MSKLFNFFICPSSQRLRLIARGMIARERRIVYSGACVGVLWFVSRQVQELLSSYLDIPIRCKIPALWWVCYGFPAG
jgi:hypothetical protein